MRDLEAERDAALTRLAELVMAAKPIVDAYYHPGVLSAHVTAQMIADLERAIAMAQNED